MRRWAFVALLVAWAAVAVSASGTVTVVTATDTGVEGYSTVTASWVSAADGTVTANAFAIHGRLHQIQFTPDAAATQPTNAYDVTIVGADGLDLLSVDGLSLGADLSNAAPKLLQFNPPVVLPLGTQLDVRVANAGNAKGGSVTFVVSR